MSDLNVQSIRTRLRLATSVVAIAACYSAVMGSANATTTVINSATGTYYISKSTDTAVQIVSGTKAAYIADGVVWATSAPRLDYTGGVSSTGSCISSWDCSNKNAPIITVDSGASLRFIGKDTANYSWFNSGTTLQSVLIANGDLIFENQGPPQSWGTPAWTLLGTNQLNGNVTLLPSAHVALGLSYSQQFASFGQNTNITLGNSSIFDIYQSSTAPLTMGGTLQGTGTLKIFSGSLTINGANTAATPWLGTLTASAGTTLTVGDATHTTAALGDPAHPTANTLTLAGSPTGFPTLKGYGTVYENVVNNGSKVIAGGTAGTLGTLTVAGNYTQDTTGTLQVEVSPTSVSALHVLGNASFAGTLVVSIDAGAYSTKIYDIVKVDGTKTGTFSSIKTKSAAVGAIAALLETASGYQVVTEVVQGANAGAPVVVGNVVSANRLNNYYLVGSLYDRIATDLPKNSVEVARNTYAWGEAFGRHSSVSRNDVGYHTTTAGFTAGVEHRLPWQNVVAGLAVSYSNESLKAKGASTADVDSWNIAAYGGGDLKFVRLDGSVFYNAYSTDLKRDFGANGVAKSSPDGYAYGGSLQISKSLYRDLVTPFVRAIITRQHLAASTEAGAGVLNLQYAAISGNTFSADLGVKINPLRSLPESKTKLLITVALEHDFSPLGETVQGLFPVTTGQAWSVYWRGDSENTALLGLDVARQITDQIEVSGRVNGRASLYQTSGEVALNARYRF